MVKRIIGTPFKAKSSLVASMVNKKIVGLSAKVKTNRQRIASRNIRDKILAKNLPKPPRPGSIE